MLFTAIDKGYIFDKLRKEGDKVEISDEWLDDYKREHGEEFSCSWLEPAEDRPKARKAKAAKVQDSIELEQPLDAGAEA